MSSSDKLLANDNAISRVGEEVSRRSSISSYLTERINYDTLWQIYLGGCEIFKSFKDIIWPSQEFVAVAEDNMLKCLKNNFFRYFVKVSDDCLIWTLSTEPENLKQQDPQNDVNYTKTAIVFIHGLMAGLGFWVKNLDAVCDFGIPVYAIDLPGFARSSRIEFAEEAIETENIFIDKLEMWRQKLKISKMILIGHSMGGYLTAAYGLAYPQNVSHLILVDPWGFPDLREEVATVIQSSMPSTIASRFMRIPVWFRVLFMVLMPFSPFSLIRISGRSIGTRIIQMVRPDMVRRYASVFGDDDFYTVPEYIFQTNRFKPTGELAFRSMSLPMAWAKEPMLKRISSIDKDIGISFIYGSRSWIDYQTGYETKKLRPDSHVSVFLIAGAGHHLFADQPEEFNNTLVHIIHKVMNPNDEENFVEKHILPQYPLTDIDID